MRIRALIAALPLLVLAACGSNSAENVVDTNPTGPVYGPATPAATTVGTATADQFPTATGAFGEKPTLTFPSTPALPALQRQVLVEGTGAEVAVGDQLVANYFGEVWGGTTPFDNSYDRGKPSVFQIGTGAVVKGWDVGLVGMKVGSRVMLTLSPSDGYGTAGKAPDIKGTDTLVFVIDIVNALGKTTFGQADAVLTAVDPANPVVGGPLGGIPTITIPAGLAEPTAVKATVIATGTGAPVAFGDLYVQYGVYDWTGKEQVSTWTDSGPQKIALSAEVTQLQGLVGVPVGSRVLLQVPADETQGSPASAIVLDLIYE